MCEGQRGNVSRYSDPIVDMKCIRICHIPCAKSGQGQIPY